MVMARLRQIKKRYNDQFWILLKFKKCPDDYHIGRADRRVQYAKVNWARVQLYFGILQSTV